MGVLVLGSGLAGVAALLAAAEAGQYAVMLEREDALGGSTVRSAGLSAWAGTDEQAEQGISDSVELLKRDLMETGKHVCDEALVDLYCANQLETYSWLKGHGVRYGRVHAASGQTVPRSHPTDTTQMLRLLLTAAGERGAHILPRTPAHRIIREDGRVTGVEVEVDGERRFIKSDAVVLATGGFSQNPELIARFAPQMRHALRAGGPGCQGDSLLMSWQLGAGFIDTPYIKGTYGIFHEPHPDEDGTGILAVYKGAIAVNQKGARFVDESLPYRDIGDASLAQDGAKTWQVFDRKVMAQTNDEVPIHEFAGRERAGMLVVADTIGELAAKIGTPPGALEEAVADYNERARSGQPDRLGRVHLSGGVGERLPVDEAPFYAHLSGTIVLATYCGVTVDTRMRVLDVFGDPIERLSAAGEVIGGFHGAGYMTGASIGKSGIFGRIAGTNSAAEESDLQW